MNQNYSIDTIIIKNKFRKRILHYINEQYTNQLKYNSTTNIDPYPPNLTSFIKNWKSKSDNDSNFHLSIVLQLLLSPTIQSKYNLLTLEYYMNQLNYNNLLVREFIYDFLLKF